MDAFSFAFTYTTVESDSGTLTLSENSAGCMSLTPVGGTSVNTTSVTALAGGGTATIINTGKMLSSANVIFDMGCNASSTLLGIQACGQSGTLRVEANSYGNATVINAKGALIVGNVDAESGGNSTFSSVTSTKTYNPFGLDTDTRTSVVTGNWSGGTALVDNAGNIGGYMAVFPGIGNGTLVGGNVWSSGYTAGIIINRPGAAILGSASANSSFQNYALNATKVSTGPGVCYPSGFGNGCLSCNPTSSDTFVENVSFVGGAAVLDNYGYIGGSADAGRLNGALNFATTNSSTWGGVQSANLTNEQGAYVGGDVSANSLFIGVNNVNGNVTSPLYGGFATIINKGVVNGGFTVTSLLGSTLLNTASAQLNAENDYKSYMLTINGQNSFTNYGTIGSVSYGNITGPNALLSYVTSLLGIPSETATIEFSGNTTAVNYGIVTNDLVFSNVPQGELNPNGATGNATFTFGQGSVLTGDINDTADLPAGESYANLTINFSGVSGIPGNTSLPGGGIYQGNIWYTTATNVTAPGRWILTGSNLYLGQATINNPGSGPIAWLQIGTPLNYFLSNPGQLLDVIIGANMDPLQGLDPWIGNSAVNPAVNSVSSSLTSNLISAIKNNPVVTGNISIGTNGGLEGQAIVIGSVSNSGYLLPGWMLPNNTSSTLVNLIANTNQILPGQFEISSNYTQTATGNFLTNFAPSINRPPAKFEGTQAGPFAPTTFWLSVAPFQPDLTPSSSIVVDKDATINGTVDVYVQTSGLYVNGDTRHIVYDVGNLTLATTAKTTQTFASPFVHFGLATGNATVTTVAGIQNYKNFWIWWCNVPATAAWRMSTCRPAIPTSTQGRSAQHSTVPFRWWRAKSLAQTGMCSRTSPPSTTPRTWPDSFPTWIGARAMPVTRRPLSAVSCRPVTPHCSPSIPAKVSGMK